MKLTKKRVLLPSLWQNTAVLKNLSICYIRFMPKNGQYAGEEKVKHTFLFLTAIFVVICRIEKKGDTRKSEIPAYTKGGRYFGMYKKIPKNQ